MKINYNFFAILFLYLFNNQVYSQNKANDYWDVMLTNKNEKALQVFSKSVKNPNKSIELLISKEILRNENGLITGASKGFLDDIMKFDDFEYYMYALWNSPYFFDNYLKTGFYDINSKAVKNVDISKIKDKTIFYALKYLRGILERDNKNYKGYKEYISQIPTIKNWQFCGVFENLNKSGYDTNYGPETYAKNDKLFDANSNGTVTWYTPNKDYTEEAYQFFTNHSEFGYGVHYAQTFIKSDEDKRVQLKIGNSSAFKVWLNDVLVYENDTDIGTDLDAYSVNLNLSKGNNRLLIKNAENNGVPYFIARLSDFEGNEISGVSYSSEFADYTKRSKESVNPEKVANKIESYFIKKLQQEPESFFLKYCLIKTYLRNQKFKEANLIINDLMKTHEKSSFLRILKIYTNSFEGNFNAVNEVNKNILLEDPNYYYSLVNKATDSDVLSRMSIAELEEYLAKLTKSTDSPVLKYIAKFVLDIRSEDMSELKKTMSRINDVAADRVEILQKFIPFLDQVFKGEEKSISEYKKVLQRKFSPALLYGLAGFYDKLERKEDVFNLYKDYSEEFPAENEFLFRIINHLHKYKEYKKSLPYIKQVLENYPYSFKAMENMGTALFQLGKKDEAVEFFKQSLIYNNGNTQLLKKVENITRVPNLLEKYSQNDVYSYVETERNKYKDNNYGSNILLDDRNIQLYETGALKNRSTFLYEITSNNGIESYKEYDLGLSGNYSILKSEIIKKNKSIIPAEKTGSKFVFNGLEIGDVIHVSYEVSSTSSGRFYKDFVDSYQFDSESFCLKTKYTLIAPKNLEFEHRVANGELEYSKESIEQYDVHEWKLINAAELPKSENYMPSSADFARFLHISTIESWNEIANWYSDLVRSQSVFNIEVEQKYNEIFPEKDVLSLSEEERARRIYYYIMNNFTYSFVNFKQSGFIPQKPAKTISSKLGDCKDFSTLFATFARKAGLDVNLVLVLTSNYGKKSIILPSQDFNHCIVKVKIDGKDQFLELTDQDLPFRSIPNSLLNATALEIPYKVDNNKNYALFHLTDLAGIPSEMITEMSVKVDDNNTQEMTIDTKISGSLASAYFNILNQDNFEIVKEDVLNDYKSRVGEGLVLDTLTNINAKKGEDFLSYTTKVRLDDKMNEMGSMTFFKLPIVSHAYNADIIDLEERKYPIFYQNYENTNFYSTTYNVEIPEGKKFIEIAENKEFSYQNHSYKITFKSLAENKLQVKIIATTDFKDITTEEYKGFKEYIEKVLKAKDILIGFKKS